MPSELIWSLNGALYFNMQTKLSICHVINVFVPFKSADKSLYSVAGRRCDIYKRRSSQQPAPLSYTHSSISRTQSG